MGRTTRENAGCGGPPDTAVQGVAVSPGIAVGPAFVFGDILNEVETRTIRPEEVEGEIARFRAAVELVKEELARDAARITDQLGQEHADVFLVHSMILEDRSAVVAPLLIGDEVIPALREGGVTDRRGGRVYAGGNRNTFVTFSYTEEFDGAGVDLAEVMGQRQFDSLVERASAMQVSVEDFRYMYRPDLGYTAAE